MRQVLCGSGLALLLGCGGIPEFTRWKCDARSEIVRHMPDGAHPETVWGQGRDDWLSWRAANEALAQCERSSQQLFCPEHACTLEVLSPCTVSCDLGMQPLY